MDDKVVVIIPTYNEIENIGLIIKAIFSRYPGIHVLVVDDDSKDGTTERVAELQKTSDRLFLIHRKDSVKGLGKSYITGMLWALRQGMKKILQMDADFSHDPQAIASLLEKSREAD